LPFLQEPVSFHFPFQSSLAMPHIELYGYEVARQFRERIRRIRRIMSKILELHLLFVNALILLMKLEK
jgi:hypothetical protein